MNDDEELAERARDAWDDPDVEAPRERHVNPHNADEIIGWAWMYGLL